MYHKEYTSPPPGHTSAFGSDMLTGGPFANKRLCSALQVVFASDVVYVLHCVFRSCSIQPVKM